MIDAGIAQMCAFNCLLFLLLKISLKAVIVIKITELAQQRTKTCQIGVRLALTGTLARRKSCHKHWAQTAASWWRT